MEIVHKAYLAIQEGPMTFPTVCGVTGEEETLKRLETTCPTCLKIMADPKTDPHAV